MESESTSEALEAFRSYTRAFQSLDPKAVARHFNEPALSITPRGVVAFATSADVEQEYGHLMADLPAQGYARTEFSPLAERRLGDDLAVVTGVGTWKTASGDDLLRFGLTYTLRRAGGGWRIIVATVHAPEAS